MERVQASNNDGDHGRAGTVFFVVPGRISPSAGWDREGPIRWRGAVHVTPHRQTLLPSSETPVSLPSAAPGLRASGQSRPQNPAELSGG